MTDLRHLLAIYVHAHQTGNSVPPHIDAEARAALAEAYEAEANNPPEGHPDPEPFQAILRERAAALAQPEPVGPTDEELDAIWFASGSGVEGREWRTFARAVLARWGHQPAPPAEGEVAELVAWLREIAQLWEPDAPRAKQLFRAADLLERLAPQPPSLAEQALAALSRADKDAVIKLLTGEVVALRTILSKEQSNTIRRALERLQELEGTNG